jgi:beta-glucanase (GH16 family)
VLTTEKMFRQRYGFFVWRGVILPVGAGAWPGLWFYGKGIDEIDVVELFGYGRDAISNGQHSDEGYHVFGKRKVPFDTSLPTDYAVEWREDYLTFYARPTGVQAWTQTSRCPTRCHAELFMLMDMTLHPELPGRKWPVAANPSAYEMEVGGFAAYA